jgi:16S rRNA (adenine1518-N6/adenine1519-N6)-dimethyltransferase
VNLLLEKTKNRLGELGAEPKRSLGQNFLVSETAVGKIILAAANLAPEQIIEIGPGVGALTDELSKLGKPLLIIELDRDFAGYWRELGKQVIENDALKVDWERLPLVKPTVLVSNLPYQISTHLVVDRCFGPAAVTAMVLMFQKEVAERLTSGPRSKEYGLLSVMAQTFWRITRLLEAGPKQFWPAPKVASQVLVFERKDSPVPGMEREFLTFLKVAFAQRRKVLTKNLLALPAAFKINQERVQAGLESVGANPKARAEELTPAQFLKLFKNLRS